MSSIAKPESVAPAAPSPDVRARRRANLRLIDRVVTGVLWGLATALSVVLVYFIVYTIVQGLSILSPHFAFGQEVDGSALGPQMFNTFYIIALSLLMCVPLAVGAAIYLAEYARQGTFTRVVRFATETLAGVPSIVLGLFGFLVFTTLFSQHFFIGPFEFKGLGYSRLAGALTLVILNLPLMVRVAEDSIRAVGGDLREASMALGADKFKTVWRVLLPAAIPGLTTGVILTAGKMIGETAALIYTAGQSVAYNGAFSLNPFLPGETLTVHLYSLHAESLARNAHELQNGNAALLIILLLVFNLGLRSLASLLNRRLSGRR